MKFRTLTLVAALAGTSLISAYTWTDSVVNWEYFGTPTSGALTYDTTTIAPTVTEFSRTLPAGLPAIASNLLSTVKYMLPDGRDLRTNTLGILPDSDDKTNLRFSEDVDVSVTFLTEGAGFKNSVGYFTYDPASPPRYPSEVKEKILFADATMPEVQVSAMGVTTLTKAPLDAVGSSKQNTMRLGTIKAGQALGFMMVSNGFSPTGRLVNGQRVPGVIDKPNSKWVFYSLRGLNPEAAGPDNLNVHTVMFKDVANSTDAHQRFVIGFEDINRETGGDHDFNDLILAVTVTPKRAIANLPSIQPLVAASDPDSDGDGVKDSLDEFPTDPTRAFSRYYPTRDTWGTLAYEDLWPKRGDYDMNDLVVRYRTREIMTAQRLVKGLEIEYRVDARGAEIDSGFAVRLPNVSVATVLQARLKTGTAAAQVVRSELGQANPTFVLFNSGKTVLPGTNTTTCSFANTQAECGGVASKSFKLEVDFTTPQQSSLFNSPYDPFIYRTAQRGLEIHLPGQLPTALASATLFGTQDDRSNLTTGKTYVDQNGRPWALNLPTEWKYPNETVDLTLPYPNMAAWAASSGASYPDWYISASAPKWLYVAK